MAPCSSYSAFGLCGQTNHCSTASCGSILRICMLTRRPSGCVSLAPQARPHSCWSWRPSRGCDIIYKLARLGEGVERVGGKGAVGGPLSPSLSVRHHFSFSFLFYLFLFLSPVWNTGVVECANLVSASGARRPGGNISICGARRAARLSPRGG